MNSATAKLRLALTLASVMAGPVLAKSISFADGFTFMHDGDSDMIETLPKLRSRS